MYIKSELDRRAETRHDPLKIEQLFKHQCTKILISHKGKFLFNQNKPQYYGFKQLLEIDEAYKTALSNSNHYLEVIYLGQEQKAHFFIVQQSHLYAEQENLQSLDLRAAALGLKPSDGFNMATLFYSQGLINWHFNHVFCAKCGHRSKSALCGHSRICENTNCAKEHFPRIEPAVIFSIETTIDGVKKLLLGRQSQWPEKRYSVIAGFAEHGESLEMAVEREALEEVGLKVDNIKYLSSQPWPFPASLMIAFSCETKQHTISLVDHELEQAAWFSAQEIKLTVENGELLMPFPLSVSWHIVDGWYQEQTGQSIACI